MSKYTNLGSHAALDVVEDLSKYTDIHQVCLHSPIKFVLNIAEISDYMHRLHVCRPNAIWVVHTPYWYNFQAPNRFIKQTFSSLNSHLRVCREYRVNFLVTHTGTNNMKSDKEEPDVFPREKNKAFVMDFLRPLLRRYPEVYILLENVSHVDERGMSVDTIIDISESLRKEGFQNIGLAFDMEHAYAHGESLDRFPEYMEYATVIHFNTIPEGVEYGKGKDKHSTTSINESKGISPATLRSWLLLFPHKIKILEAYKETAIRSFQELLAD